MSIFKVLLKQLIGCGEVVVLRIGLPKGVLAGEACLWKAADANNIHSSAQQFKVWNSFLLPV